MSAPTYTCAMCGETFETDWSDEEACAEAESNGIDPKQSGLVCDDCYKKTPYADAPL